MVDVANDEIIAANKTKKHPRPDGLDVDRYKGMNNWSYRKWAWEFLRRNTEFIAECERVEFGTDEEKKNVALKFGLKKYKSYKESYKNQSGYPKFVLGTISSWSNLDADKEKCGGVKIKVGDGQVVIRFDLASAINDEKALDKQLRLAEIRLKKHLATYEKRLQMKAAVHKHKALKFGIYIRLLDYMATGKTPLECAKLIFPSKVNEGDTDYFLRQSIKSPISAAKKIANEGYIYLSILRGKPDTKSISVTVGSSGS